MLYGAVDQNINFSKRFSQFRWTAQPHAVQALCCSPIGHIMDFRCDITRIIPIMSVHYKIFFLFSVHRKTSSREMIFFIMKQRNQKRQNEKKRGIRRATRTAWNKFGIIQKNIWRHLQSLLLTRSICHLDVKMYFFLLFYDIFLWRKCKAFRVAFGLDICWVIWSMGDHLKFLISYALVRETNTSLYF